MTILLKGLVLLDAKRFPEAIEVFDQGLQHLNQSEKPFPIYFATQYQIWMAIAMYENGQHISEYYFSTLLQCMAQRNEKGPPVGFMLLMSWFIKKVSPARTLELILDSPAAALLQPLVISLQQILGQEPRVPKEVEEVVKDIRNGLETPVQELKAELSIHMHNS